MNQTFVTLDGTLRACVARPEGARARPGLILCQEAYGVNAHMRDVAARFAAQGYVAIAPELFHRTAPGFEGRYDDFASVTPHVRALTVAGIEADVRAAYDWLRRDGGVDGGRVVAVGYCMGGRVAFIANSLLPLAAAVSYYGGGIPALLDRVGTLSGRQLFFWGGKDKHIPPEQHRAVADALRAAGKSFVDVEFADADHGFFCDQRAQYEPRAARESWALTLAFLTEALSPNG